MKPGRLTRTVALTLLTTLGTVAVASPAAAVTSRDRLAVLSSWSQPGSVSYNSWNSARQNQAAWTAYRFDWSTDYCSVGPDQPLGFDFRLSCGRHDFGYRNYTAAGLFSANKARVDDAFYADMRIKCTTYNAYIRPSCYSVAWTYYEAVHTFGGLYVRQDDLDRAAAMKAEGEARSVLGAAS
jgi:hypothetical protein